MAMIISFHSAENNHRQPFGTSFSTHTYPTTLCLPCLRVLLVSNTEAITWKKLGTIAVSYLNSLKNEVLIVLIKTNSLNILISKWPILDQLHRVTRRKFSNPEAEEQPCQSDLSSCGTPVTDMKHRGFSRKGRALQPFGSDPLERENIRWSFIVWQYILSLYTVIWELPRSPQLNDLIDNRLTAKADGQELNSLNKVLCYRQKHTSPTQTTTLDSLSKINKYLWICFYAQ